MTGRVREEMLRSLLLVVSLLLPAAAFGDLVACAKIEGANQGVISDGDVSHVCPTMGEGIQVLGFGHSVLVPVDPASGSPTGQRQHQPFKILKAVAKSSPTLAMALASGELLSKVTIQFYRVGHDGSMEHFYTIELQDAMITNITTSASQNEQTVMQELVSMVYRRITWTDEISHTTYTDEWSRPPT